MSASAAFRATKPAARVITTAWGEDYVNDLLAITLPALLAPGNLPELAKAFSCEFVLVTESRFFEPIRRSPVFTRLETYCGTRLLPIDDLIIHKGSYGLSLTYAYHRAFADLGERMTSYYLFFFNADFILADGCYRSLAARLMAGEGLVLAPSYCVNAEVVTPLMQAKVDQRTYTLSMRPREMAALALENRHNTIKGKTVNQNLCHLEWIEQFYWNVDPHTLLAHQLPISIVCLKPERVYVEPVTPWDYGLLSEICPNTKPCVLADSDDFIMLELRKMSKAQDQFMLGWPSIEEIASKLESFSTKDQREQARYQLVLHSRDLPPETEGASTQLGAYVDSVLAAMKPPLDHRNHMQWTHHYEFQSHYRRRGQVVQQLLGVEPSSLATCISSYELEQIQVWLRYSPPPQSSRWPKRLFHWIFGRYPRLSRNHAYWTDFRYVVGAVDRAQNGEQPRQLLITSESAVTSSLVKEKPGFLVAVPIDIAKKRSLHRVSDLRVDDVVLTATLPTQSMNAECKPFDICLCELDFETLLDLRDLINNIKTAMKSGGKIIIFHLNSTCRPMTKRELSLLLSTLLGTEASSVYFGGAPTAYVSRIARKLVRVAVARGAKGGVRGILIYAAAMLLSIPFARYANKSAERNRPSSIPQNWTSVTIEIDIQ